ncbi:hypothetical protein Q5752_005139 [Cryptotrichosporon argae]
MDVDAQHQPPQAAESSAQALKRLLEQPPRCPTPRAPSPAAFHPRTSAFIYPPPMPSACRVASTFAPHPPSQVAFPPVPTTSYNATVSPDGAWVTTYLTSALPTSPADSGTLLVYASSVLSPAMLPTDAMPVATFILPSPPLAIAHLYPPRALTPAGRARPRGPRPPPAHTAEHGPTFLALAADQLYLFYPRPMLVPAADMSGYSDVSWTLAMLRVPLDVGARVDAASPVPRPSARIDRGWMQLTPGDRAVWIATQTGDTVSVMRVDVRTDLEGALAVETTVLPVTRIRGGLLTSVVFYAEPTPSGVRDHPREVRAALLFNLDDNQARVNLYTLRWGAVETASSFAEIGLGDAEPRLQRWSIGKRATHHLPDTTIIAVDPLIDVSSGSLCMALLSSPAGAVIAHLDVAKGALIGERKLIHHDIADAVVVASPGLHRASVGVVAVVQNSLHNPTFFPGPQLQTGDINKQTAQAVVLAMAQRADWSDCMRCAFSQADDKKATAEAIIRHTYDLLRTRGHVLGVLQVQVAALANDTRCQYALELVRIVETCRLFRLAMLGDGAYETNTVWFLLDVFDWSVSALGQILRDAVLARTWHEWTSDSAAPPAFDAPSRAVFILHPQLRALVLDWIKHLEAFAAFVARLDRPILPALALEKDARGTLVGQMRIADTLAREGVDLALWGAALGAANTPFPEQDLETALLTLTPAPLAQFTSLLDALPSPSPLFMAPEPEPVDGVTFAPLEPGAPGALAMCDRCATRTRLAAGRGLMRGDVPSPWTSWVRLWNVSCMCGGTWLRTKA